MRILLVFRAPVGGLFRHVYDLAKAQSQLGHDIGIICDAKTGGETATRRLTELQAICTLGVKRMEMSRLPGLGDAISARRVAEFGADKGFDIIHGHGAKGGAYARIAAGRIGAKAIYTPHGGSLHYSWNSASGALFLGVERMLLSRTDGLVFVCDYERTVFDQKIGVGLTNNVVVHNGLWPHEFSPARMVDHPSDILFIGELRALKGVDVLIKALAKHPGTTATIVGDGPDRASFETLTKTLGMQDRVTFTGAMPAQEAFGLGRLMVVPSRAESFPYIVLEAIAAHKPLIASNVGGISEILPDDQIIQPDNVTALANQIGLFLNSSRNFENAAKKNANQLKNNKNTAVMATEISAFYQHCMESQKSCSSAA